MGRLALIIFSMSSVTLMGIAIVAVLTAGYDTLMPILYAAAAGLIISVPVTWFVAKKIDELK